MPSPRSPGGSIRDAAHDYVFRIQNMDGPHRRPHDMDTLDENILAIHRANERGPERQGGLLKIFRRHRLLHLERLNNALPYRSCLRPVRLPYELEPFGVIGSDRSPAADRNIFQVV